MNFLKMGLLFVILFDINNGSDSDTNDFMITDYCKGQEMAEHFCEMIHKALLAESESEIDNVGSEYFTTDVVFSLNGFIGYNLNDLEMFWSQIAMAESKSIEKCDIMDWSSNSIALSLIVVREYKNGDKTLEENNVGLVFNEFGKIREGIQVQTEFEFDHLMSERQKPNNEKQTLNNDFMFSKLIKAEDATNNYCQELLITSEHKTKSFSIFDENILFTINGKTIKGKQEFISFYGQLSSINDASAIHCELLKYGGSALSILLTVDFSYNEIETPDRIERYVTNIVFNPLNEKIIHVIAVGSNDQWLEDNKEAGMSDETSNY
jgi:hypothetical protein